MADIFVYDANAEDFDTLGLCGPLSPTKCVHIEEANGMSELTIEHPIDQAGRWAYLTEGRIVKAEVPVRTVPPITDAGDLVTSIEVWSIKSGVRPNLYYKAKGGKIRKKKLASGLQVRIVLKDENRYKAAFTARKKVKKKWKTYVYYGWIDENALVYVTVESIPADPEAIEQVAPAWKVTDQLFRIHATNLTDKGVTVSARHIWYDMLGNVTTWTGLSGGENAPECLDALHGILDNCTLPHEFEGYTNIIGTRDTIEWTRISPVEALCDPETGLLARWGAELVRDNMEFYALAEAGLNRGVRIEYAKNLLGVTCDVDMTDVVTRIQPVGQTSKGKPLLLAAGTYSVDGQNITIDATGTVVSPREGDYPTPHVMVMDVSDAKAAGKSAAQVRAARVKMIRAALAKFAEDADLPRVSLKVDFIALGDTEEYAQYQRLDDVFLYDRVRVWHPKIGVDVLTKVNRIEFDCLLERFVGIELGSVKYLTPKISAWQLPSNVSARQLLAPASIESVSLADGAVNEAGLDTDALTSQKTVSWVASVVAGAIEEQAQINDEPISYEAMTSIKEKMIDCVTLNAQTILADNAHIDWAQIGTLVAQMATVAQAEIGNASITTAQIADAAITRAKIGEAAIGAAQIEDAAITNAKIENAAIDTAKIALGAITQALISEGAIGTAQIADASITDAKIVELSANRITAGVLSVERLIIRGTEQSLIYAVNNMGDLVSTQVDTIDGYVLTERTITADKIIAHSITANEIAAKSITANEMLAGTITGAEIAGETITGANIKAGTITTGHVTSDFGQTLDLSSNTGISLRVQKVYEDMDALVGYRLELVSTSDILSDAIQNTTLTARVWHGSQDVTATIPVQRFKWKRVSADNTADNLWNAAHMGLKSITLTVLDVQYSATYSCELTDE